MMNDRNQRNPDKKHGASPVGYKFCIGCGYTLIAQFASASANASVHRADHPAILCRLCELDRQAAAEARRRRK